MSAACISILSVNVGLPAIIGTANGEAVVSGIAKRPVASDSVFLRTLGIEGDGQADLDAHGGVDKAVYAYPSEHWAWWQAEKQFLCAPNSFGENLTLFGGDESDVRIGERFRWGGAILEISQPRAPCFKLALHTRDDIPARLTVSARSGWYFRVVETGFAPVRGALLREHESGGPSVREAFVAALHPRVAEASRLRVRESAELSPAWKRMIR